MLASENTTNEYFGIDQIVTQNHIDDVNHVNNVVYLDWVNDISKKHWFQLSDDKIRSKYIWVVLRHEIDYLKPSYLGDTLKIKTWVSESSGFKSVRQTEIYNKDIV